MLEGDSNLYSKFLLERDGYVIKNHELIEQTLENQLMFTCMSLAGDVLKARELYYNEDILEIEKLILVKLAFEYKDPTYELEQAMEGLKGRK